MNCKTMHVYQCLLTMLLMCKKTIGGGQSVYICEYESQNIICVERYKLRIIEAMYGRKTYKICNNLDPSASTSSLKYCSEERTSKYKYACDNKRSCSLTAMNNGSDPCSGTKKYLYVNYECVPDYDLCEEIECFNGGICKQLGNIFHCECIAGYAGERCGIECPSVPTGCTCYATENGDVEIFCSLLKEDKLPEFGHQSHNDDVAELIIDNCANTIIENETFSNFADLRLLVIGNNDNLAEISSNAFQHAPSIETIKVRYNTRLSTIKNGLFANLTNLKYISLRNNNISIIEDTAFSNIPHLKSIDLRYNHIGCDDRPHIPTFSDANKMWALWGIPKDCDRKRSSSEEDDEVKIHGSVRFRRQAIDMQRKDS